MACRLGEANLLIIAAFLQYVLRPAGNKSQTRKGRAARNATGGVEVRFFHRCHLTTSLSRWSTQSVSLLASAVDKSEGEVGR